MTNSPTQSERYRDAYHEAGHAVVGWALGLSIGRVWLKEDGGGSAEVETCAHLSPVDQTAICFGGWAGAELSGVAETHDLENLSDEGCALNIGAEVFPDDDEAQAILRQQGIQRAQDLLKGREAQLRLIAEELNKRGELGPGEIARLLGRP